MHRHQWKYYHGVLGYESSICEICKVDYNDLKRRNKSVIKRIGRTQRIIQPKKSLPRIKLR